MNTDVVLQATGLVKRYGQVTALDGADFELRAGEILAVIGDNGAGKSSLIKALSGATVPDSGEIRLDGRPIHFRSPSDARRAGMAWLEGISGRLANPDSPRTWRFSWVGQPRWP